MAPVIGRIAAQILATPEGRAVAAKIAQKGLSMAVSQFGRLLTGQNPLKNLTKPTFAGFKKFMRQLAYDPRTPALGRSISQVLPSAYGKPLTRAMSALETGQKLAHVATAKPQAGTQKLGNPLFDALIQSAPGLIKAYRGDSTHRAKGNAMPTAHHAQALYTRLAELQAGKKQLAKDYHTAKSSSKLTPQRRNLFLQEVRTLNQLIQTVRTGIEYIENLKLNTNPNANANVKKK